jgi:SprB repeat
MKNQLRYFCFLMCFLGSAAMFAQLSVTTSSTSVCNGNDGTASAVVTGGVPPYSYVWANYNDPGFSASTQTITGLGPGFYGVTAFDASGAQVSNYISLVSAISAYPRFAHSIMEQLI